MMKERILPMSLPRGRRIIAISDIHGNLPYLEGLLDKLRFGEDDILFILGDFTEKGPRSLDTLRYIMALSENYTVHTLCGNCDIWAPLFDGEVGEGAATVLPYMERKPYSLARQMCEEMGMEFSPTMDYEALKKAVFENYGPEMDFLRSLPTLIETEDYVFVHGGVPENAMDAWDYMKFDRFMHRAKPQKKWTIVGHWPVMLYHEDTVEANPVFDYEKKIISIDGGCVLKDDGQLNALIIPEAGSVDFSFVAYDAFPTAKVPSAQRASEKSWYIRWGDALVEVLERGEEFSRCRHVRTGYEMDILTKYLYGEGRQCEVNDCTDYVLSLQKGDTVSIVEETSRGYFVKHNGISGWYFGELEREAPQESKPQRKPLRLKNYDYSQNGAYFITICTQNRTPYFGQINSCTVGADSISARIVAKVFENTIAHYPGLECSAFVVMPDHFHAIIVFDRADMESAPTLSDVVQTFKRWSTAEYSKAVKSALVPPYDKRLWQRGFYDHVIRNDADYLECIQYIEQNPQKYLLKSQKDTKL